jgi:hypothetical protein
MKMYYDDVLVGFFCDDILVEEKALIEVKAVREWTNFILPRQ